ncbi:beta-N-acetylhexosaminidase [Quatrionicoccus australiensis]|uniref:beta-N-acetylhexosaminidase n=1 Tax=Quatrionicoccus australiensis TaxID=138118 RepID=UPI001CFA9687|nr:beta-N-acetylhexosaminidase [Quatrionicoccus australiensis]MCB4361744.1 beta-N-acetylhexosaminidase [Quatrionicoccus australiensis]
MSALPYGPLMIDIAGQTLTDLDRQRLCHPLVGGIILFSRNFASREQLTALTDEIHALREPRLLIAVDHEGGRVQRFRDGFTRLPAMRTLGELYQRDAAAGLEATRAAGLVLAAELRACGVDYSFTPVLDLDYGPSRVIGDRAFHRDPEVVIALASALGEGLHAAGMGNCGKHYPGHGYVIPDSHVELPIDDRALDAMQEDLLPYRRLALDAVMAAHVIYECFDCNTAVFSSKWIDYLRNDIKFDGVVFTDDLSMAGAGVVGDMLARVQTAYAAGCDMLLVCNAPDSVALVLDNWQPQIDARRGPRVGKLLPQQPVMALTDPAYLAALAQVAALTA